MFSQKYYLISIAIHLFNNISVYYSNLSHPFHGARVLYCSKFKGPKPFPYIQLLIELLPIGFPVIIKTNFLFIISNILAIAENTRYIVCSSHDNLPAPCVFTGLPLLHDLSHCSPLLTLPS